MATAAEASIATSRPAQATTVVAFKHLPNLGLENVIAYRSGRAAAGPGVVVGARCDLYAVRARHPADRLAEAVLALVDTGADQRGRRSSFAVKQSTSISESRWHA